MKQYRVQVLAYTPSGWSRDDLLAHVVSGVSAVTIVDAAQVLSLPGGIQRVAVTFQGLNDNEAHETVRHAQAGLPVSADTILSKKEGRRFEHV